MTVLAPLKPVPVIVTEVPPAISPATGLNPVTAGEASKLNRSAAEVALVPTGVVTVTSTEPASSAGVVTVSEVPEEAVMVPATVPKLTALTPLKPVPVMTTDVPPVVVPPTGLTALTAGEAS